MSHIFISYSRKDFDFAQKIVDALAVNKLDTWIDWKSIPKGEDWEQEIYRGIEEADAFLFLISPDSVASQMCNKEIDHAVKNGKRILPIVIRDADPKSIHSEISKRNWIFCRGGQDDFNKAVEETRKTIHTDYEWLKYHTELQVKALKWEQKKDTSRLLRGKELREAEQQLAEVGVQEDPQPTKIQREYILASQRNEIRTRRQITIGLSVGLVIMVALSFFAWSQRNTAVAKENARATAQANAEEQAKIAFARQLAAQSKLVLETTPQLSVLLSIEAKRVSPQTSMAYIDAVEDSLRQALSRVSGVPLIGHTGAINVVAFSQDGHWLATGSEDKTVRLWDMTDINAPSIKLTEANAKIMKVIFSHDSHLLAINFWGTEESPHEVQLWNISKPSPELIYTVNDAIIYQDSFSFDGHWLAISSPSGKGSLLNLNDLQQGLIALKGVSVPIEVMAFDPNGRWLAAGELAFDPNGLYLNIEPEDRGAVFLWDLYNLSSSPVLLRGNKAIISSVVFDPSGKQLGVVSYINSMQEAAQVRLYNIDDLSAEPITLEYYPYMWSAYDLKFSVDGTWLGVSNGGRVYLWNKNSLNDEPTVLELYNSGMSSYAFSPDGNIVAVGFSNNTVGLWDMNNIKSDPLLLHGYIGDIWDIEFSPDGKWIATGSDTNIGRIQKVDSWETEPKVLLENGEVDGLKFKNNTNELVSFGCVNFTSRGDCLSGIVSLWDVKNLEKRASSETVGRIYFLSADGKRALSEDFKFTGVVTLYNIDSESISSTVLCNVQNEDCSPIIISPDGNWLAYHKIDELNLWDLKSSRQYKESLGDESLSVLAFNADSNLLAIGQGDIIQFWHLPEVKKDPLVLHSHTGSDFNLEFSPDGKWLISDGDDNILRVWNAEKLNETPVSIKRDDVAYRMSFSENGRWLVEYLDQPVIFKMDDLSVLPIDLPSEKVTSSSFSPFGNWLAVPDDGNFLYVWDLSNLDQNPILLPHGTFSFSPNKPWLAVSQENHTVKIYSLNNASGEAITLLGDADNLTFSSDGQYLAGVNCIKQIGFGGGCSTSEIKVWNLTGNLAEIGCAVIGRNFTQDEWLQYFPNETYHLTCPQWLAGD